MTTSEWVKKKRGWSTIWTHPKLDHAIVDTNGYGLFARISYKNHLFDSVKEAKKFALQELENVQV